MELIMHIVVAVFYGFVVWVCVLAYTVILQGSLIMALICAPLVISGVAAGMMAVSLACSAVAGWIRKVISAIGG